MQHFCFVLLFGWLICSIGAAQNDSSEPQLVGFTYAEGYSSRAPAEPIDLGFRAFTLYSKPCEGLPITDTVVAEPARITLKVGERYFMPNLILRVYDRTGELVPRAPIWALMLYRSDILQFDSDNDRNFSVIGTGEGEGLAYFNVGCRGEGELPLRVDIPVIVVRQD